MLLNLVLLFILYKVLDYVIRIPFISNVDRRKIMVTGCDSGLGRLFAIRMANKGVTVFASCMTDDGKKQLEQSSTNIKAFIMDTTDVDSVQKAYEFVTGHLASNEGHHNVTKMFLPLVKMTRGRLARRRDSPVNEVSKRKEGPGQNCNIIYS
ncbi:hypothetical protein CAPTEDRAFT_192012 [Capitella teleta]|uniref:Uncharacterized protein n=1 Tax=Capitella teleta TaxID=283909 RepID=R7THP0_CAPTE|nr:hypothetical protein CAPTEDRAFT_192012 [Capitella teleta]|eukprot:ELT90625.1 hypothetical protein CAPTEDRAFT_192012 [Capitella teleta]